MPMIEPATAVAISQRKNSWPSCIGSETDDPHHRLAGRFERGDRPLLLVVLVGGEAQIGEDAVIAVDRRRAQRLGVDRHDALAELAGRFGEQLFEPGAEIGDALARR